MIDITKNKIVTSHNFPESSNSFFIEGDVIIPDAKPDVENILFVDAFPIVHDYSVNSGQITISGNCEFDIIYVSEKLPSELYRISTSIPFKNSFTIPNLTPDSAVDISISSTKISSLILNGRKISISSELELKTAFSVKNEIDFIDLPANSDSLKVMHSNQCLCSFISSNKKNVSIKDTTMLDTNLPTIKEIIKYETKLCNIESITSDNKIIFKGELNIKIYYSIEGSQEICCFSSVIPFSQIVDDENINDNNLIDLSCSIATVTLKLLPDSDDLMRIIELDVSVCLSISIFENKEIEILLDAYDMNHEITLSCQTFNYDCYAPMQISNIPIKTTITMPSEEEIKILSCFSRPKNIYLENDDSKTLLKGLLELNIPYLSVNTGKISSYSVDLPLEHVLDNTSISSISKIDITDCQISQVDGDKYEVKILLTLLGKDKKSCQITLPTQLVEDDSQILKSPGLTIYFIKPHDSLWSIAKRFHTTIEELTELNSISDPSNLSIGAPLII